MSELQASYDSIAQAAAALNETGVFPCTKETLRKAKKLGAPGFRGSRVYTAELVPWLKERLGQATSISEAEPTDKEGWEIRRMRLQCEGLVLANRKAAEEVWDSNTAKISWLTHMRAARQALISMVTDLAPRIAGRSAEECEAMLRKSVDGALAKLRGNPYGEAPAACVKCGEAFVLILDSSSEEPLKAKEKKKAKR